jgi:hypothetical protein
MLWVACRVGVMAALVSAPTANPRPVVRTRDDYLRERDARQTTEPES